MHSASATTDTVPALLVSGPPKCGTHFLDAVVHATDRWRKTNLRFSSDRVSRRDGNAPPVPLTNDVARILREMKPGQMAGGHIIWTQEFENALLGAPAVRHAMIYRDPRDAIISMMRWQTYNPAFVVDECTRQRQNVLRIGFIDDSDRLKHFILLMRWNPYAKYARWLKSPACHAVRFEDLYGELSSDREPRALRDLMHYIGVPDFDIDILRSRALHKSETSSGETRKIGLWRDLFTAEHLALLDYPDFKEGLEALGYA